MRRSILAVLVLPMFAAVANGGQLCRRSLSARPSDIPAKISAAGPIWASTLAMSPDRLADLKLKEEHGVEVTLVDQDAPAGKAGIKEHDVILSLNGNQVESVEQLRRMIREIPPGRMVNLGISRDGQSDDPQGPAGGPQEDLCHGRTGQGHSTSPCRRFLPCPPCRRCRRNATPFVPEMDMPVSIVVVHSSARSGLMVENLTPQLGDFFGAKNGKGVLVRSVEKGSRAEQAGFRAGDVIVKVNGESISDSGDFTHAMHGRKGSTVTVSIIREKKEQNLTLTVPDRNQSELLDMDETFEVPDARR